MAEEEAPQEQEAVENQEEDLEPEDPSPWTHAQDDGVCISMHQPWASLLVYGFKRVEGRTWSTPYRGRSVRNPAF